MEVLATKCWFCGRLMPEHETFGQIVSGYQFNRCRDIQTCIDQWKKRGSPPHEEDKMPATMQEAVVDAAKKIQAQQAKAKRQNKAKKFLDQAEVNMACDDVIRMGTRHGAAKLIAKKYGVATSVISKIRMLLGVIDTPPPKRGSDVWKKSGWTRMASMVKVYQHNKESARNGISMAPPTPPAVATAPAAAPAAPLLVAGRLLGSADIKDFLSLPEELKAYLIRELQ